MTHDGVPLTGDNFGNITPNTTRTENAFAERPWLFEPGAAEQHTAALRIFDTCTGGNQSFILNSFKVDVVGAR